MKVMAQLLACWKCHQAVYENARCKNCAASYDLPTRSMMVLVWTILMAMGLWLLFTNTRALAIALFLGLVGYLIFMLGRNHEWKRTH